MTEEQASEATVDTEITIQFPSLTVCRLIVHFHEHIQNLSQFH